MISISNVALISMTKVYQFIDDSLSQMGELILRSLFDANLNEFFEQSSGLSSDIKPDSSPQFGPGDNSVCSLIPPLPFPLLSKPFLQLSLVEIFL